MKHIWDCRRTFIAVSALAVLGFLGYTKSTEVAMAISSIAIGIGAANAYEKRGNNNLGKSE